MLIIHAIFAIASLIAFVKSRKFSQNIILFSDKYVSFTLKVHYQQKSSKQKT